MSCSVPEPTTTHNTDWPVTFERQLILPIAAKASAYVEEFLRNPLKVTTEL